MKKWCRRTILLLLSAVLCLTGCQNSDAPGTSSDAPSDQNTNAQTTDESFVLPYTATDSLNPYTAKTKSNQELCLLLFDSLVRVGADFTVQNVLANSISVEGQSCTVTLKEAHFSDGTAVTAEDVVFSFSQAKASTTSKYASQLATVTAATATSGSTVRFSLSRTDPYAAYLLDFPILKKGSEDNKTSDNKQLPPTGSGRYLYHADATQYWLSANSAWQGGAISLERIELTNLPDAEALEYSIEMGGISFYYTNLQDGIYPNMSGRSVQVPLHNLVYLGINPTKTWFGNPLFRHAISLAISRNDIVKNAYYGSAVAATGPYHANFSDTAGIQTISTDKNIEQAVADLAQLGYNNKDADGYLVHENRRVAFTITCNADSPARLAVANSIASALKEVGIEVQVRSLDWNAYLTALQSGNYEVYIAEMKIPNNFDLFPMMTAAYGVGAGTLTYLSAKAFSEGTGSLNEVISNMNEEMLLIPLCHRSGVITYRSLEGTLTPGISDIFAGIESCTLAPS